MQSLVPKHLIVVCPGSMPETCCCSSQFQLLPTLIPHAFVFVMQFCTLTLILPLVSYSLLGVVMNACSSSFSHSSRGFWELEATLQFLSPVLWRLLRAVVHFAILQYVTISMKKQVEFAISFKQI